MLKPLDPNRHIGNWPSKAVIIHYHFAKLYLDAYVLRGLPESAPVIPDHFLDTAASAVAAATGIVNLLLEDQDLQKGVAGVPHWFHGLIAFACMFLLKVATKYSAQLFVNKKNFEGLISGLAHQLRITKVGKDHLIHRMAEGLEKVAEMLARQSQNYRGPTYAPDTPESKIQPPSFPNAGLAGQVMQTEHPAADMGPSDPSSFGFGDPTLGLGMPFFDFEGTSLSLDDQLYSLAQ